MVSKSDDTLTSGRDTEPAQVGLGPPRCQPRAGHSARGGRPRGCYSRAVIRLALVGPSWPLRGGIARTTTALAAAREAARAVLGRCAAFMCHARSVARGLGERFAGTPLSVHPLPGDAPPAADRAGARARFGLAPATVAVLSFGLIRPYKGVEVLLDAVAHIPRSVPLTVLLAGEPW